MSGQIADSTAAAGEAPKAARPVRPFSTFERMIAWRYLRSRRREAFISVIAGFSFAGIMLGVATLIVVMAVMNGFRAQLIDRILGVNGHMIIQPMDQPFDDYAALAEKLAALDGVKSAMPLVDGQVLATGFQGSGTGALVRGIRADDLASLQGVADHIKTGDLVGFASGDGVAIGMRMASSLGVLVGDMVTLTSPEGDITPLGVMPRTKAYPVSAIFEVGMSEINSSIVFMPLKESSFISTRTASSSRSRSFSTTPMPLTSCGRSSRRRWGSRCSSPTGGSRTGRFSPPCRSNATSCS